jgi:serine/threonine-protein kinase
VAAPDDGTSASGAPAASVRWNRFRLLRRIGHGGYGEIYQALDTQLDREVALKLLKPSRTGRAQALQILAEARMLAQVRHPNVVAVYGAAEHDGRAGFWMELVHGDTFEELLRLHGPWSAAEAALAGQDLCRALAALHGAGLLHRDVKTANIMRETGGRVVLMDLGAGSSLGCRSGGLIGTPQYTAPEVCTGAEATVASDLYSLGVVLFRLVTARYPRRVGGAANPFEPADGGASLSLRDLRPDLPEAFVGVVERALCRDPRGRPASAGSMRAALGAVLGIPQTP